MTSAEYCRRNGFDVGTRLVGNEGHGPTIIEITAIGKEMVLAKTISHNGVLDPNESEGSWVFWCREWSRVSRPTTPRQEGWRCDNCFKISTGMFGCIHCGSNAC